MPTPAAPHKRHQPDASPMDWGTACAALVAGQRVRRIAWASPEICYLLQGGVLHMRDHQGKTHQLVPNDGDFVATDWVLVHDN